MRHNIYMVSFFLVHTPYSFGGNTTPNSIEIRIMSSRIECTSQNFYNITVQ
jgi:hypothetical protein